MKKQQSNQSGFGAIELFIIVIVIAGIAGGAYFVSQHKTTKQSSNTTQTQSSTTKTSLKSYCDMQSTVCFKYPQNWKVESSTNPPDLTQAAVVNTAATANIGYLNIVDTQEATLAEVDLSNPLDPSTLTADNVIDTSNPVSYHVASITPTADKDYVILGGYAMSASGDIPSYFVVDASLVTSRSLSVGKTADLQLPLSLADPKQANQFLVLGGSPISKKLYTTEQAVAWFSTADAKDVLSTLKTFYLQ